MLGAQDSKICVELVTICCNLLCVQCPETLALLTLYFLSRFDFLSFVLNYPTISAHVGFYHQISIGRFLLKMEPPRRL